MVVNQVTNLLFYVDKLKDYDMGAPIQLPEFFKAKSCVIGLDRDHDGRLYDDNFCLFRCLLYHRTRKLYCTKQELMDVVNSFCKAQSIFVRSFPGVKINDLHLFEDHFGINIEVYYAEPYYCKDECRTRSRAKRIRRSRAKYEETMNLNVFRSHFSYITDLSVYTDTWECKKCSKLFKKRHRVVEHERNCNTTTTMEYPGGGYGLPKTLFECLKENGIDVPKEDQFFPYRVSFDCEALSVPIDDERGKKECFLAEQIPASISVSSNVPGFTNPKCIISDGSPERLVECFYMYLKTISMQAYDILSEKFESVLNQVNYYKLEREYLLDMAHESSEAGDKQQAQMYLDDAYQLKIYDNLYDQLDQWLGRIPVLGFNSGKYDFNLLRKYLFPYFIEKKVDVQCIIKKGNDYLSVSTPNLLFLDIKNYVAAGTSYAKWLAANDVPQRKGFFPYSWFTDLEKLKQTCLPDRKDFWSDLTQSTIDKKDYAYLKEVWRQEGFRTMRDLLVWYNNLDVQPFLEAAEKMFQTWKGLNIDCFKGNMISLPGLALNYLTQTMEKATILPLFDEKNQDVLETIQDNIVGGLSVVMHRYHEVNETKLPNGKPCGWIYSHDCNSLYLLSLIHI